MKSLRAVRLRCRVWAKLSAVNAPSVMVRNPATGETVTKAADKQVKFSIAKALKDSVNA